MAVRKTLSVVQIKDIAGRLKTGDINCLEVFVIKEVKEVSHIKFL